MPLKYYGFSDKPFELSPDLKFLYLSPGHRIALEAVSRGITDRKGLIVLTGEVGTGKTMLIYGVMKKLPPQLKTAFIFHSTYDFKELLQEIFSETEETMPPGEISELRKALLEFLARLKEQGKLLALFLDEAQKLSEEIFKGLFSLLEAEPWVSETLQVVLVGQPELEEIIQAAFLRYHPKIDPFRIKIKPLSREESLEYIEHRLRKVGRSSDEIFSPPALSLIVEKAAGIPRVINIICDYALFAGYQDSVKRIEANLIEATLKNLEGPDYQPQKKKRPPDQVKPLRLSLRLVIRDGLIVIVGSTLVVSLFLFKPELTRQLKYFRWEGGLKMWPSKRENVDNRILSQPKVYQENSSRSEGSPNLEEKKSPGSGQSLGRSSSLIRKIQVKEGDYLSGLVAHHYGKFNESLIDLVLRYNSTISNIDLVLIHQKLSLPELTEEILLLPNSQGGFNIHVGTYSDLKEGDRFKDEPALKGKNITIKPKKVSPRQTWYRVEAGSYGSENEALAVIKKLREKKLLHFF